MSATFLVGALVHASKLSFGRPNFAKAAALACDYFALGKWSVAYGEVLILRLQLFPWVLAATAGIAATATFQAASNVAAVINPIILGIGNAIPQAAAEARLSDGTLAAWRVARGYILFGLPPILAICAARTSRAAAAAAAHIRGIFSLSRRRPRRAASRCLRSGWICRRDDLQRPSRRRGRQARFAGDRARSGRSGAHAAIDCRPRRRRRHSGVRHREPRSPHRRLVGDAMANRQRGISNRTCTQSEYAA